MSGASIEVTLELWVSSLRDVKVRMRSLFTQERVAVNAGLFLDGLLGDERRKTGWMRAIRVPRASRRFSVEGTGMPMRSATLFAIMLSSIWRTMARSWCLTRPGF